MSDYNVVYTENWINSEITASEQACYQVAVRNGLSQDMADNCDSGMFNCCGCPFGGIEIPNGGTDE